MIRLLLLCLLLTGCFKSRSTYQGIVVVVEDDPVFPTTRLMLSTGHSDELLSVCIRGTGYQRYLGKQVRIDAYGYACRQDATITEVRP